MAPNCFKSLALVVVAVEGAAVLGLSFGLFNLQSLSRLPAHLAHRAASAVRSLWPPAAVPAPAPAPTAATAPSIEPTDSKAEALPAPTTVAAQLEPSESTEPAEPAESEPASPAYFDASEVSFCYGNALAALDSSDASGSAGSADLAAVEEGTDSQGSLRGADSDAPEGEGDDYVSAELVFEPSSTGVPGMRMLSRGISGLAVRTEPASRDSQASPLLVDTYAGRFVEVINGQVKVADASEPAYVSEPLAVAAHSPRRTASRMTLGPVASISPGSSSTAL